MRLHPLASLSLVTFVLIVGDKIERGVHAVSTQCILIGLICARNLVACICYIRTLSVSSYACF